MLSIASPFKSKQVRDRPGRDAHELGGLRRVIPRVVLHGIHHVNPVGNQLEHVLVAGNNNNIRLTVFFGAPGDGSDDIVSFETRIFENGYPHGFEKAPHERDLRTQIGRHLRTVGFVFRELLGPETRSGFKDSGHVFGLIIRQQLLEHVVEDEHCFRGYTLAGTHWWRTRTRSRMVRTENESVAVNEKQPRLTHEVIITDRKTKVGQRTGPGTVRTVFAKLCQKKCDEDDCYHITRELWV